VLVEVATGQGSEASETNAWEARGVDSFADHVRGDVSARAEFAVRGRTCERRPHTCTGRVRCRSAGSSARRSGKAKMIPTSVRVFVCTERQDMRRSFDTLALTVKERLELDPQSGALFVFANKRGNRLKVLWFDHNGYCVILYKRLHHAHFEL